MFKVQEIRELIKLVGQSDIDEFVYEADGAKLKMKKHSAGEAVALVQTVQKAEPVQQAAVAAPVTDTTSTTSTSKDCSSRNDA